EYPINMVKYTLIRQKQSDFSSSEKQRDKWGRTPFTALARPPDLRPGQWPVLTLELGHSRLQRPQRTLELLRVLDELLDRLGVGIGLLLHHRVRGEARSLLGVFALHHARRDADHRGAGRYFLHHHRVRADARAIPDGETAED